MKKFNRFLASALSAGMLIGSGASAVSAGALEGESAVAGMAVTLNNYYAGEEAPEDAILEYLVPLAQTSQEAAEPTEPAEVRTVMEAVVTETSASGNIGLVSTAGYLNVREQPSTSSVVVGRLYSSCQVVLNQTINNDEGSWYAITCGDVAGYVSAAYILTGEAAKQAESNIENRYAVVKVETLDMTDSASAGAKVIGQVLLGEEYPILEDHGDYVKIHKGNSEVGFVAKSGITIKTRFAEAQKIDDEFVANNLRDFMTDINYAKNAYEQYLAEENGDGSGYYRAYSAMIYAAELLGYYSEFAADSGLAELAEKAKKEQESAIALAEAANEKAAAAGYYNQVASSVAQSEAAEQPVPEETLPAENPDPAETLPAGNPDDYIQIEVPTVAYITGIEACYNGGHKYVGDVIYTAELFIRATYSDGTVKEIHDGWYSPQVGMMLRDVGYNVVTMYYDNYASNLEVWADPAPTQPAPAPTQPAPAPTEPAPAPTQPAPVPTQPAPAPTEPAPAPTQPAPVPTPPADAASLRAQIVAYAMSWVGRCNYVYGGTNLVPGGGVDCSGFTMQVYGAFGIYLPHYSMAQPNYGYAVTYEQLVPGDLICFNRHVGIYIGDGLMVHAASAERGIVVDSVFYNKTPIAYRRLVG